MAANSGAEATTSTPTPTILDPPQRVEIRLNQPNLLPLRNYSNPIQNRALPPILQRRSTLPSAQATARRFFRNRIHKTRNHPTLLAPAAVDQVQEEGIPTQRGAKITIDPYKVLQASCAHEKSTAPLPEYDNLSAYFVSEDTAKTFLQREIARLIAVVENPEGKLRFSNQKILKEGSRDAYKELSFLFKMVMQAVSIAILDNEVLDMKYGSGLSSYRNVSKHLGRVRSGHLEIPEEDYIEACFILVNYVTAILIRLITQSGSGDYWHNNLVGVLAKLTAKIKVLLMGLKHGAVASMMNAEAALEESGQSAGKEDEEEDEEDCEEIILTQKTKEGKASPTGPAIALYCAHQAKFRSGPFTILNYILMSLQYLNRSGHPMTSYEALLFQDRDYEFQATSDLDNLNVAHSAFNILNQTVLNVQKRKRMSPALQGGPSPSSDTGNLCTKIEWKYSEEQDQPSSAHGGPGSQSDISDSPRSYKQELILYTMEDIITVMVPLVATSPVVSANLNGFRTMVSLTGDVDDDVRPYTESKFDAFFRMYTSESDRRQDALQLSKAVQSGLFSRSSLISGTDVNLTLSNDQTSASSPDRENTVMESRLRQLIEDMDEWVYDESSVIVNCALYVWSVIAVATTLVLGGLAIGITVNERLKGVDPFSITTYAWILAAFIILISKSYQVESWPWRDFLLCQVKCRSVSELQTVTGIHDQLIMAKILHDERGTILNTRGPYNSVFQRRSEDGSGFSIDRPLTTRTLLLSGLTMLKVVTPQGHALVCLDARRGTDLRVVTHRGIEELMLILQLFTFFEFFITVGVNVE
ncbi:hypothetical protein DFP73DRAFT_589437 [Morchella snyderi]|nr:hypothetical protein DFP73DRAFT_589437 [Morchella snyderi]